MSEIAVLPYRSDAPAERQAIITNERQLGDLVEECRYALIRQNTPRPILFARGGAPVHIVTDEDGRKTISFVAPADLSRYLTSAADFFTVAHTRQGDFFTPAHPPTRAISVLPADLMEESILPPIISVAEAPILRADGTVVTEHGYDEPTRTFYAPSPGLIVPPIPPNPTCDEVRAAVAVIDDVIGEFPWRNQSSKANAFAMLLTPSARPAIKGCAPIGLVDGTSPGTGKSLFVEVGSRINTGFPAAMRAVPSTSDEWRKGLTAIIQAGNSLCIFDNLDDELKSGHLAEAVSGELWSDRILGFTEERRIPQRTTFIVTGNSIRLGGDLSRRCYWIRLDAGVPLPWLRDTPYRHKDLKLYVTANRGRLLAALLTMATAWFVAGQPKPSISSIGGFEEWTRVIGGILEHSGIEGFLGNREQMYREGNPSEAQWTAFLSILANHFGDRLFTTAELLQKTVGNRVVFGSGTVAPGAMPDDIIPDELEIPIAKSSTKSIGRALLAKLDRYYGDHKITKGPDKNGSSTWKIVRSQSK
jgi:hypothetical protein